MNKFILLLFGIGFLLNTIAQDSQIIWQKQFSGSDYEGVYSTQECMDGGLIMCGYTYSNDGDFYGHMGASWYPDGWVAKLNANGDTVWTRPMGGTNNDYSNAVIEDSDGNYVIIHQSSSDNNDVLVNYGDYDFWLVKMAPTGAILWSKNYGGTDADKGNSIVQAQDGNYVILGSSESNDMDVTGHHGTSPADYWLIKVDKNDGTLIWENSLGGTGEDVGLNVNTTADGGYILTGYSWSSNDDVSVNKGTCDYWVVKTDGLGNLVWEKSLGGSWWDYGYRVEQTSDGGYVVTGCSYSDDGDVSVNHGGYDVWTVKLDSLGNILWEKNYGGTQDDFGYYLTIAQDGGYAMTGYTFSNDFDVTENLGEDDGWVIKTDQNGTLQWQNTFGGDSLDRFYHIMQKLDGSYIVSGHSKSFNGDLNNNAGEVDDWIVQLACNPPVLPEICLVTVDSTSTKNMVVWQKPVSSSIESFNIYRDIVGTYTMRGNVLYDSLSQYVDTDPGINPNITSYRYKISTVDTCGTESDLSDFHETIHLTASIGINDEVNLVWDNYEGFSFLYYRILRDSTGSGNWHVVDSVSNSNFTYSDFNVPSSGPINYTIEIVPPGGVCSATRSVSHNSSRSNITTIADPNAPLQADFNSSSQTISVGGSVSYSDVSSGSPTTWSWTFQGGIPSSSTQQNPQNVQYNSTGCFDVTLVVSDGIGTDSVTQSCYINVVNAGAPIATFTSSTTQIYVGDTVYFFDLSSNQPTSWNWIFTNGNPFNSNLQNPIVAYNSVGCHDVTLVASNASGSNTNNQTCYIEVLPPQGIEHHEGNQLTLFPNPVVDLLFLSGDYSREKYRIFDVVGKVVYSGKINGYLIQTSMLSPGVYYIEVGQMAPKRFIKL